MTKFLSLICLYEYAHFKCVLLAFPRFMAFNLFNLLGRLLNCVHNFFSLQSSSSSTAHLLMLVWLFCVWKKIQIKVESLVFMLGCLRKVSAPSLFWRKIIKWKIKPRLSSLVIFKLPPFHFVYQLTPSPNNSQSKFCGCCCLVATITLFFIASEGD